MVLAGNESGEVFRDGSSRIHNLEEGDDDNMIDRILVVLALGVGVSGACGQAGQGRVTPWVLEETGLNRGYGGDLCPLGDVNGNGTADLAIASGFTNGPLGTVEARDGGTLELLGTLQSHHGLVPELLGLDDVDGDGVRDLAARRGGLGAVESALVLSGADGTVLLQIFPASPATATLMHLVLFRDVTGDGVRDVGLMNLAVGPFQANDQRFQVADPTTGAIVMDVAVDFGPWTGLVAAAALGPDLTGDGVPDLAIGQPTHVGPLGQANAGAVSFVDGATLTTIRQSRGTVNYAQLGRALVWDDGDLSGDGIPELHAGEPQITGFATSAVRTLDPTSGITLAMTPARAGTELLGWSLTKRPSSPGSPSTLVAAVQQSSWTGDPSLIATTVQPSASFTSLAYRETAPGNRSHPIAVADIGDVNGDGLSDLAVSAQIEDPLLSNPIPVGYVFIYRTRGATAYGQGPAATHTLGLSWNDLLPANQHHVALTGGTPQGSAFLLISARPAAVPLLGAVVLADLTDPGAIVAPVGFDATGTAQMPVNAATQHGLQGVSFFVQGVEPSAQAPEGLFASNGVQITF